MSNNILTAMMMAVAGQEKGPDGFSVTFTREINVPFGATWASGRATPFNDFEYEGEAWRLYQIIPFIGGTDVGTVGDARIQIRNRDVGRNQNTIEMMPDRITITRSEWTGSPWTFNKKSITGRPGGGNQARVAVDYSPTRTVSGTPASNGVSDTDTFTIELHWDV